MVNVHTRKKEIDKIITKTLLENYIKEGKTLSEIADLINTSVSSIRRRLVKFGIILDERKNGKKWIDLTGKKLGNLTVLFKLDTNHNYKGRCAIWSCRCDCGNITNVSSENLQQNRVGHTKSCGCSKNITGNHHPSWKGCGDISGIYWCSIKSNAKRRNLLFEIDIQFIWELFLEQNKKCALTGFDLNISEKPERTASLDRIDSKKGYTKDNVQWVHKDVNWMKQEYPQDRFIEICKAVSITINTL